MNYTIDYYSDEVQSEVFALPKTLQARYISLSTRMMVHGANLGEPHTKSLGDGLFELRLKGAEGIARVGGSKNHDVAQFCEKDPKNADL